MQYIVSADEMKRADLTTSSFYGIDSSILMERASVSIADHVIEKYGKKKKILVLAGSGGNGGDGVCAARILYLYGANVSVFMACEEKKYTELTKKQVEIAKKYNVPFLEKLPEGKEKDSYEVVIDALFGVGLNRALRREAVELVNYVNELREKRKEEGKTLHVLAVDIPSGISADTGEVMEAAIKAEETITFAFLKRGLLLYPGKAYAGKVILKHIGITQESFLGDVPKMQMLEKQDFEKLPLRKEDGHKGTFGKVLVIAGSHGMAGASIFSAKAALRTGAGMVKIMTSIENRLIVQTALPETMVCFYDEKQDLESQKEVLSSALQWADVCVAGPGLSTGDTAETLMENVVDMMQKTNKKFVLDADAINILSNRADLLKKVEECSMKQVVFTPHLQELARLAQCSIGNIKQNLIKFVCNFVQDKNAIYVCKDARTVVCYKDRMILNTSGDSSLATAGSGDVLTGMIAAFLANVTDSFMAVAYAVFLHGMAGSLAGKKLAKQSVLAGDIIENIPMAWRELFEVCENV